MRVLIDALSAREGGGVTYIRQMLPALVRAGPGHDWRILLSPRYQQGLIDALPPTVQLIPVDLPGDGVLRRVWYEQIGLRRRIRHDRIDMLFTVTEIGAVRPPCAHVMIARNLNVFVPLSTLHETKANRRLLAQRLMRKPIAWLALRCADFVVAVSTEFRQEVIARVGLDPALTSVVHHGASERFRPGRASDCEEWPGRVPRRRYLLAVSSIAPHKDYETLVGAYGRLTKLLGETAPDLVIAGDPADAGVYARLIDRIHSFAIVGRVHFVGRVPHDELPVLYRHAQALMFTSRLESFGLPLVEAMASGVPVIATALPICREVCGDAALYAAAGDEASFCDQVAFLLTTPGQRVQRAELGLLRARQFSWNRSAEQMVAIMERLLTGRREQGEP